MSCRETDQRQPGRSRVLIVDDCPDDRALVRWAIQREFPDLVLEDVLDQTGLDRSLEAQDLALVVTDYHLCWSDGVVVLASVKGRHPDLPVIMFTGTGSEQIAADAMKLGLDDYVLKSADRNRLVASVRASLRHAEERKAARRAEETLLSLRMAVDALAIGVTIADPLGRIAYTNPAEAVMHGYGVDDLLGKEARILVPMDQRNLPAPEQGADLRGWKRDRVNVRRDGTTFDAQLISDVVRRPTGEAIGIVTTCEDITDRKRIEEQLRKNAFYDALTDLPNRLLFMDRLRQSMERSKRGDHHYAVLFFDLDRFKLINDSFGHGIGDELLVQIARRLEKCLRPGDTIARLGGDEFAILADGIQTLADAIWIARRTLRTLEEPLTLDGHEVYTSASIGIALGMAGYGSADEVLRDADTAMYRAKGRGKCRYEVFGQHMREDVCGQLRTETELRRALERGEFRLYYQPIVAGYSGSAIAAEALVRWAHPQRGLLLPAEFLPIAEETGLIGPLTDWIMREACMTASAWQTNHLRGLRVAVNVSARAFRRGNISRLVRDVTRAAGLEPQLLELEITEGTLMENAAEAVRSLEGLKDLGLRLSVDDFGTGYSSLSYLKRFPVDTLKIDQSFLQGVTVDPRDAAIVTSVIGLARSLNLQVVAEGVETEAQAEFLRRGGCEAMQGFLFSYPLPPELLEQFLLVEHKVGEGSKDLAARPL